MRADLPSTFQCRNLSQSTTLTCHDVLLQGLFVAETGGITITLPTPQEAVNGSESLVVNHAGSSVTLSCPNGFLNDLDVATLIAGASVQLYCTRISGGVYRWAVIGTTPVSA